MAVHLYTSAVQSKKAIVLVDNDANPNIEDNNGCTPVHHAVQHNPKLYLVYLLKVLILISKHIVD